MIAEAMAFAASDAGLAVEYVPRSFNSNVVK
jgi:hypothetical protein